MVSISTGAGLAIAGAGSVIGGGISALGATSAAKTQAAASQDAAKLAYQQYLTTRGDLSPFVDFGKQNLPAYAALPGQAATELTSANDLARANIPGPMSQEWLEQQPGYQFTRDQGLKSVQAGATARGLGVSGAAMGAGANFATGLANQYYKTAFDQAQTRFSDFNSLFSNIYNKYNLLNTSLSGQASIGENAAAQLGSQGTATAGLVSQGVSQAGQATAAGTATAASSIGNALSSASGLPLTSALLTQMGGLKSNSGAPAPGTTVYNVPGTTPGTPGSNSVVNYNQG